MRHSVKKPPQSSNNKSNRRISRGGNRKPRQGSVQAIGSKLICALFNGDRRSIGNILKELDLDRSNLFCAEEGDLKFLANLLLSLGEGEEDSRKEYQIRRDAFLTKFNVCLNAYRKEEGKPETAMFYQALKEVVIGKLRDISGEASDGVLDQRVINAFNLFQGTLEMIAHQKKLRGIEVYSEVYRNFFAKEIMDVFEANPLLGNELIYYMLRQGVVDVDVRNIFIDPKVLLQLTKDQPANVTEAIEEAIAEASEKIDEERRQAPAPYPYEVEIGMIRNYILRSFLRFLGVHVPDCFAYRPMPF